MVQRADAVDLEPAIHTLRRCQRLHRLQRGDGGGHGVAHHQHARALGRSLHCQCGDALGRGTGVHNGCRVIGVGRAQIALGYLFGIVVDIIVEGAEGVDPFAK